MTERYYSSNMLGLSIALLTLFAVLLIILLYNLFGRTELPVEPAELIFERQTSRIPVSQNQSAEGNINYTSTNQTIIKNRPNSSNVDMSSVFIMVSMIFVGVLFTLRHLIYFFENEQTEASSKITQLAEVETSIKSLTDLTNELTPEEPIQISKNFIEMIAFLNALRAELDKKMAETDKIMPQIIADVNSLEPILASPTLKTSKILQTNTVVESLKSIHITFKIEEALKSLKSLQVEMEPANATDLNSHLNNLLDLLPKLKNELSLKNVNQRVEQAKRNLMALIQDIKPGKKADTKKDLMSWVEKIDTVEVQLKTMNLEEYQTKLDETISYLMSIRLILTQDKSIEVNRKLEYIKTSLSTLQTKVQQIKDS